MELRSRALAAAGADRPQCLSAFCRHSHHHHDLSPPVPPFPSLVAVSSRSCCISLDADRCKYAAGYMLHILAGGGATCYSFFSIDTLHGHPLQAELQFLVRQHATDTKEPAALSSSQKWSPPPEDHLMFNCEAARGNEVGLVFAAVGHVSQASQAMHAEAITVKRALFLAELRGIGRIIVATDCKNMITAVTFNDYDS